MFVLPFLIVVSVRFISLIVHLFSIVHFFVFHFILFYSFCNKCIHLRLKLQLILKIQIIRNMFTTNLITKLFVADLCCLPWNAVTSYSMYCPIRLGGTVRLLREDQEGDFHKRYPTSILVQFAAEKKVNAHDSCCKKLCTFNELKKSMSHREKNAIHTHCPEKKIPSA